MKTSQAFYDKGDEIRSRLIRNGDINYTLAAKEGVVPLSMLLHGSTYWGHSTSGHDRAVWNAEENRFILPSGSARRHIFHSDGTRCFIPLHLASQKDE